MPVFTTEGVSGSGRAMQIYRLNKSSVFSLPSLLFSAVVSIFVLALSPADLCLSLCPAARIPNANMKMSFRFRRCFRSVYYSHSIERPPLTLTQSDRRRTDDDFAVDFVTLRKCRRSRSRSRRIIPIRSVNSGRHSDAKIGRRDVDGSFAGSESHSNKTMHWLKN